ncbi:MAG: TetR/AcrR family transcriptional regulator [Melioribacteraceae bacterium]|nr:TetR/AcrR family transcriptional regulator [Melioribacteraceae bacterium]MCF8356797.1 TetR/AcrR family transcriptional regulator [Melioribacteraceae bacterium]MCF8396177.1 TetR/AcrR family transcriptional regulator [Melioribacteraceae bacterium]MCF8421126.1 TetR/AcrR family transcriptional regulator [Melioribacteraceae bacterium]
MTTKEKIISTSLDLFSQFGYDGTSVRQIAREVGVRESAIYNHFSSKQEILKAIFTAYKKESSSAQLLTDDLINELVFPLNFMVNFTEKLIRQWSSKNDRQFLRLLLKEQYRVIEGKRYSVSDMLDETRSIWWMIFDELIKHKFIKEADPKDLANEFIYPLFMIRMEYLFDDSKSNTDAAMEAAQKHVQFFWRAINK